MFLLAVPLSVILLKPGIWKRSFFCKSGSESAKILPLPLPHKLFDLKSNLAKTFCPFSDVGEMLLLLPDPFRWMGTWRKTMEPQKPGNSPRPGPEVVERQRVAKGRAAQRVRSWAVQNEMRGVLERVYAGAAGRILDSANPREIRA